MTVCFCLVSGSGAAGQVRPRARPPRRDPAAKTRMVRGPVRVCVVVRGGHGSSIGGLRSQNFRLYDNGRPQRITDFAENLVVPPPASRDAITMPRYFALYFDDIHLDNIAVIRATDGAYSYFSGHIGPWDRVGVFTASGENTLDFTADLSKLHQALLAIRPHPAPESGCPKLTDYEAYLILYAHDPVAREVALEEARACRESDGDAPAVGKRIPLAVLRADHQMVEAQASGLLAREARRSSDVIDGLYRLINRVSALPDPRSITFISPGFITADFGHRIDEISEHALSLNIIINTIDMSSQLSEPNFDPSGLAPRARHRLALAQARYGMQVDGASMAADILTDLPGATGGTFVPNTYSMQSAFPMALALPSSYYVLTYYPRFLRRDGTYHEIRVALVRHKALFVQARDGYYAPGTLIVKRRAPRRPGRLRRSRR